MTRRAALSLRIRLIVGAGVIAALAVLGAGLSIYGATEISHRVNTAVMAQQRMEMLSVLSARVNDYGMVAAEVTRVGSRTDEQRNQILQSRSDVVADVFARLDRAIAASVEDAASTSEEEQIRRATQGLGLARMRAQFDRLTRTLSQHDGIDQSRLRVALDGFATQFSPLLDQAIAQERRDRDAAFDNADVFRQRLLWIAGAVVALALIALLVFQLGLVRPLFRRIESITQSAKDFTGDARIEQMKVDRHDELGLLFANVNRMAARLNRQRLAVESDRSALNAIIDARTEELTIANTKLETADSQRRRFFADVSHELRTPLTVILGEAELGMRAPTISEDQSRESMTLIHTRAKRLNRRIDDLLRVARSESGEIELADEPFKVLAAVTDAVDDLASLANRRNLTLQIKPNAHPLAVGDRDWVRQVVSGLIDNSIRHSQDGATISVTIGEDGACATIVVRDGGQGIDTKEQESIFERFRRGEHASERSGFGVGLALARWVIERQAGTITVRSPISEGRGTEITIRLPSRREETQDDAHARPDR